jgi:hypothetical protein
MNVDVNAYKITTQATAEQTAAEAKAAATVKEATARREAAEEDAKGQQAALMAPVLVAQESVKVDQLKALIPVEAARQQVDVERAQADVERARLANQAEFETIARELALAMRRIEAEETVGVAHAQAMGVALSSTQMQIFGDPATLTAFMQSMSRGQQFGALINGAVQTAPQIATITSGLADAVAGIMKERFGTSVPADQVQSILSEALTRANADGTTEVVNGPKG